MKYIVGHGRLRLFPKQHAKQMRTYRSGSANVIDRPFPACFGDARVFGNIPTVCRFSGRTSRGVPAPFSQRCVTVGDEFAVPRQM
jgi:hypothetical protein